MNIASLLDRASKSMIDSRHPLASLLRWPRWLIACAVGRPKMARFATGGLRMELIPRLKAFGSTAIFIRRDEYEPELLAVKRVIRPGSTVIDIGGSYGIFSLFMAHFAGPEGRVFTFEPGRFSFGRLTRNIALNRMEQRILIHNLAASDTAQLLMLSHFADSPVNFSVGALVDGVEAEQVKAERVDAIVPKGRWADVTFIKIDVEGYEKSALEGARGIIETAHPVVMFEVSDAALARQDMTASDMFAFMASLGYRMWLLDAQKRFVPTETPQEGNIFAAIGDLSKL